MMEAPSLISITIVMLSAQGREGKKKRVIIALASHFPTGEPWFAKQGPRNIAGLAAVARSLGINHIS